MARPRPVLLTAVLSAAAVLGIRHLSHPDSRPATARPRTRREHGRRRGDAGRRDAAGFLARQPRRRAAVDLELARQTAAHQLLGNLVRAVPARDPDAQGVAGHSPGSAGRRHRDRQTRPGRRVRRQHPVQLPDPDRAERGLGRRGALGVNVYALPFTIFTGGDGSILGVHTGELHAEHLERFRAVVDDLGAGRIGVEQARRGSQADLEPI